MKNIEKYLTDNDGNPSSIRLNARTLLKGIMWFNGIVLFLTFACVYLVQDKAIELLIGWACFLFITNCVGLAFVFLPKNMAKKIELEPLIKLAEKGINTMKK